MQALPSRERRGHPQAAGRIAFLLGASPRRITTHGHPLMLEWLCRAVRFLRCRGWCSYCARRVRFAEWPLHVGCDPESDQ